MMPATTAIRPKTTERKTFRIANWVSPVVQSVWVSRAKVENVVNPPRNPVARRGKTHPGALLPVKYPKRQPIRKQPRRLQTRIPAGKRWIIVFWARDCIPEERPYRASEPRPPPRKTRRAFMREFA